MSNNYDTWKSGGYEREREDEQIYTEYQIAFAFFAAMYFLLQIIFRY